jgi:hypothetical protein
MVKQHTPLSRHKKSGTKLLGPMSSMRVQPVDWARDLLPEHLWIAALAVDYGLDSFHTPFNRLLDAIDEEWQDTDPCLGFISDLGRVPESNRPKFLEKHHMLVDEVFVRRIGRPLSLFPDCPAAWLIDRSVLGKPVDPNEELGFLVNGRDEFAGRVRSVTLNRLFKHNRLKIASDISVVPLLEKYPPECTGEERQQVEAFARSTVNMLVSQRQTFVARDWPKYFWRHNYDLVVCRPLNAGVRSRAAEAPRDAVERITKLMERNEERVQRYLENLGTRARIDLYDPLADEILFGLFARISRIFSLLMTEPALWAKDMSGIALRCLAETAITFSYLASCGTPDEFQAFKRYGEGQEKLLMLHLQDNHPSSRSPDGLSAEDLSERLGGFGAELIDIELGHWTKKDTRSLAKKAGVDSIYRLVFSPTSSDIHGTWLSLQATNLVYCGEALHRYHRLPTRITPMFYPAIVDTARSVYCKAIEVGVSTRGYPAPGEELELLSQEGTGASTAAERSDSQ